MINTMNISTVLWVEVADIFLGSLEMLLKQDSDHLTEAFNYRGSPSSYLFHSSAFSFIIKPSSIILLIYMLSQACAGAINISMVFVCVCVYVEDHMCSHSSSSVAAIQIKVVMLCALVYVKNSWGKSLYQWFAMCLVKSSDSTQSLLFLLAHTDMHISTNTLIHKVVSTWQHRLKSTCWVQSYCICLLQGGPANRSILLWSNSLGGLWWFLHLDVFDCNAALAVWCSSRPLNIN